MDFKKFNKKNKMFVTLEQPICVDKIGTCIHCQGYTDIDKLIEVDNYEIFIDGQGVVHGQGPVFMSHFETMVKNTYNRSYERHIFCFDCISIVLCTFLSYLKRIQPLISKMIKHFDDYKKMNTNEQMIYECYICEESSKLNELACVGGEYNIGYYVCKKEGCLNGCKTRLKADKKYLKQFIKELTSYLE